MRLIRRRTHTAHPSDVLERISNLLTEFRTASAQDQIVPRAMEALQSLVPSDAVLLLEYPAEKRETDILYVQGIWEGLSGDSIERNDLLEQTKSSGQTQKTDLSTMLEQNGESSLHVWNTPLRSRERIFGSLWIGRAAAGSQDFTPEERQIAIVVAEIIALGLLQFGLTDRVENQQSQIQAMRSVTRAITSSLDLNVTLNVFLDQVMDQFKADASSILLMDAQNRDFSIFASRGFHISNRPQSRIRIDHSLASQASVERKIVSLEGSKPEDPALEKQTMMREEEFTGYYAAPLIAHGKVKGVLEIFRRSAGELSSDGKDVLESLALQGAIAIDSAEALQNLQRTHSELALACDSTIEGWSRAVDLRAQEAEGHSQRVSELSIRTAERMGMAPDKILPLRRGALLHDIGKLGIPDRILWKPNILSEEEWTLVRQHPLFAEQLLSPIEFLRSAMDIPKYHHERWDGSGYPYGLKGHEIPLAARIFSVVDVWDSMQAHRPFRQPWNAIETLEYIQGSSGQQFDPDVISSFLQVLQESEL